MEGQDQKEMETPATGAASQAPGEPEVNQATAADTNALDNAALHSEPGSTSPQPPVLEGNSPPLGHSDPVLISAKDAPPPSAPANEPAVMQQVAAEQAEMAAPDQAPRAVQPEIILAFQIAEGAGSRIGESITKLSEKVEAFRLPPSQVGQPYSCVLDLSDISGLTLDHVSANNIETIGLTATKESNGVLIHGNPTQEFDGSISFKLNHSIKLEANKAFHVNPDPRSLWKQIEPLDDEGYPKEHLDRAGREMADDKRLIAASRRGRSHAHEGKFREDAFRYDVDEQNGWIFLAVADGAGSAKFSRKGSDLACQESVRLLRETLGKLPLAEFEADIRDWNALASNDAAALEKREKTQLDKIFHHTIYHTWMKIKEEADQRKATMRDYYTTLLLAIIKKFDFGWFMASYWVGDGAVAIYCPDNNPEVIIQGKPDGGEFAGQTRFLTMKEEIAESAIRNRMRYRFLHDFKAIMLMSDGVSDPFFEAEADLYDVDRWYKLWQDVGKTVSLSKSEAPAQCAEQLLEWLNFWAKGNHDDRTFMILY